MRKTVKILALLMALTMVAACFAGCGNDEKEVREVVEGYIDSSAAEIDNPDDIRSNLEEYLDPDGDAYEDMEDLLKDLESGGELTVLIYNEMNKRTEREITEIEINGDEATVKLESKIVDDDEFNELFYEKAAELGVLQADEIDPYRDQLEEAIEYAGENADTKTEDGTVTLKKIDSEWLISKIK